MGKTNALKLSSLLVIALLLFSACSASYSVIKKTIGKIDPHDLRDGTFVGSYFLLPVSVKAEVTVKSGRIESIRLLRHFNGQGKPAEKLIPIILEKQSIDVDVITGATHSSLAILKAVEAALKKGRVR
ncbi:MAG TPA: FMN-binding protein [Rectinemataceae bacterium]|nr:FMN-binding protein [Rectinemataceae bacterium]